MAKQPGERERKRERLTRGEITKLPTVKLVAIVTLCVSMCSCKDVFLCVGGSPP